VPTHPDRAGGLGFLAETGHALSLLVAAHGALVAAQITNRIFFDGETLPQFVGLIGIELVFVLCLTLGPMLFFAGQLTETKRTRLREYGALAGRYVQAFDAKWPRGGAPADEAFIGSADIQWLADLGGACERVGAMRLAPISREAVLAVAAATLAPIAPLVLTMIRLDELLKKLLSVVF
jgi:hypothetical protein